MRALKLKCGVGVGVAEPITYTVWRLTQIELGEISPVQLNAWVAEGKAWLADPSRVHAWVQQVSGRAAAGDGEGGYPPPA